MNIADPTKTHLAKDLKYTRPLVSCRFDAKGRFVFAGSEDNTVQRWDLATGKNVALAAHDSWVHALASSADGETFLTGGCDGKLIWWPTASEKPTPIRTVEAHAGWINAIAVNKEGTLAATCGNDRMVRLWSMADGKLIHELPGHPKYIYQVAFEGNGRTLVSADINGMVIQWDVAIGKEARRIDAAKLSKYDKGQGVDYGGVRDMAFSADGSTLACSGLIEASNPLGAVSNPALLLIDWKAGKEVRMQRPKEDLKGVGWGVRSHPDGFFVEVSGGTSGGFLLFFKPDQVNEFFKFALPNTGRGLDMHPDGIRLATAHHDGYVRIWAMQAKPTA
jgi:WD40 repeat protein